MKNNPHITTYIINGELVEKEKRSYETNDDAIIAARKMNISEKIIHKLVAYKCPVCGKFHIGRNGKPIRDKDRERYKKNYELFK